MNYLIQIDYENKIFELKAEKVIIKGGHDLSPLENSIAILYLGRELYPQTCLSLIKTPSYLEILSSGPDLAWQSAGYQQLQRLKPGESITYLLATKTGKPKKITISMKTMP